MLNYKEHKKKVEEEIAVSIGGGAMSTEPVVSQKTQKSYTDYNEKRKKKKSEE